MAAIDSVSATWFKRLRCSVARLALCLEFFGSNQLLA